MPTPAQLRRFTVDLKNGVMPYIAAKAHLPEQVDGLEGLRHLRKMLGEAMFGKVMRNHVQPTRVRELVLDRAKFAKGDPAAIAALERELGNAIKQLKGETEE